MALISLNRNPNDRQLRQFGLISLVAIPLVTALWTHSLTAVGWSLPIAGLLAVCAAVAPQLLKLPFLGLSVLALPIGLVAGELVLVLIYFGLFTPMAVLARLVGRDVLQRKFDRTADSYWQKRIAPQDVRRYYRQY